ncbi:MAG: glycosyltransferase family 39 protein [Nitrospirae bacterium]|nr:glycosyltransferase family 39 protein [Nitrospirota bacterium]
MSLSEIDTSLFFSINHTLQNNLFDAIMPFITSRNYLLFFPLFIYLFFKDRKKAGIALAIAFASLALSDWSSYILKQIFERPRPCNTLEGVHLLVGCSSSYSMPSNHAANAFAFATPFYILFKERLRYAFIIVALLVGFSRVYVGVHYPSDVLAGALLGVVLAISVIGLYKWSSDRFKEKPYTTILFIFLIALSLFRIYYITRGPLDLSPDEAHYWEWSRRLDWSYYSKGPMIAYLVYLGTSIFGDTVLGIRIMAVIFSAISSILLYILGKKLYDEQVGLSSAVLMQIVPLFSTFGILFTIDSPFIFFWILSLFLFYRSTKNSELRTPNSELNNSSLVTRHPAPYGTGRHSSLIYWFLLGLSIGVGLLTKYTMAFFYLSAFLFLLLSKENRGLLLTKGPYIAFITSLIIFSPVIIWNANHDWVTFRHTAGQAHLSGQWSVVSSQWLEDFLDFFGSQIGIITPILFFMMFYALFRLQKLNHNPQSRFLLWFSVPVIAFFLLKSIHGKVQANWALPGYLTGIIAFSAFYIKRFHSEGRVTRILITTAVLLSVIVTSVAHYPSILNLPSKQDPTSRLRGWEGLGAEVTRIYEGMSAIRPVFIFSDRYQVSSELAFYVNGHPVTYSLNLGHRMNQYDLWPGFNNLLHYDAIFVRIGDTTIPDKVASAFEKVEKRVFTAYTKKQIKIRDYSIFLCYDFKGLKEEKPESY